MFNGLFSLGNLAGIYSGSPLVSAVGSLTKPVFDVSRHGQFDNFGPLLLAMMPFIILISLLSIAACALMIISWWKVFEKAGRPGWAAIVPIYNIVVMLQIVEMSPWLVLVAFIPWVGGLAFFIISIFLNIKLAKLFNKDEGFAVGLILLPIVFVPILAFGQASFNGKKPSVSPVTPPQNPPTPTPEVVATPVIETNIADQTKPTDIV